LGRLTGWIHNNHFTDNKLNDDCVNDVTVDIGQNKDWSISDFKEVQRTTIEGKKYVEAITKQYYNDSKDHNNIQIPAQKDESDYTLDALLEQQQAVVLALINAIVKLFEQRQKIQTPASNCDGLWWDWKIIYHKHHHLHSP
jgi:hypothetical protein